MPLPPAPEISVIVPAYHQGKTIVTNLSQLSAILDSLHLPYEIICVVDGGGDDTLNFARSIHHPAIKVEGYDRNVGKGHAVRFGLLKARGQIIGFVDAGKDIDYSGLPLMLEHFRWYRADIIIGSKRHPASKVTYPWQRRITSWGYQQLVRFLFGLNLKDTQVGMKFFRRPVVRQVMPKLLVKKFAFDIEMLAVARSMGFNRIYEAPVVINMEFGGTSTLTSTKFLRTVFWMLWDTLAVFYRLRLRRYYSS